MNSVTRANLANIVGGVPQHSNTDTPQENRSFSAAPLTPILDGIDRALGFSPPIRAGALSLLEREHNLHPGELWAIAAMAWGVGA
jgi:hypothetical protein